MKQPYASIRAVIDTWLEVDKKQTKKLPDGQGLHFQDISP
jgi:hypothetical protein